MSTHPSSNPRSLHFAEMLDRAETFSDRERGELADLLRAMTFEGGEAETCIERLTRERDEWAAKWHRVRAELAELKYPGMKGVIRPLSGEPTSAVETSEELNCTTCGQPLDDHSGMGLPCPHSKAPSEKASECQHSRFEPGCTLKPCHPSATHENVWEYRCGVCQQQFSLAIGSAQNGEAD